MQKSRLINTMTTKMGQRKENGTIDHEKGSETKEKSLLATCLAVTSFCGMISETACLLLMIIANSNVLCSVTLHKHK